METALKRFSNVSREKFEELVGRRESEVLPPPGCKHAQDTGQIAFINAPCKGNKIICAMNGHITYRALCAPEKCRYFEDS